mgnify:CR=1 FL=1
MTKPSISHEEATRESLRKNPDLALAYLNDVLEDGDEGECLLALRRVVEASGGIAHLAQKMHRALSAKGNPTFRSLFAICYALGIRMSFSRVA